MILWLIPSKLHFRRDLQTLLDFRSTERPTRSHVVIVVVVYPLHHQKKKDQKKNRGQQCSLEADDKRLCLWRVWFYLREPKDCKHPSTDRWCTPTPLLHKLWKLWTASQTPIKAPLFKPYCWDHFLFPSELALVNNRKCPVLICANSSAHLLLVERKQEKQSPHYEDKYISTAGKI